MADFVSEFWHWFIAGVSLVSILVLFPFLYMNRGKKQGEQVETMGHVWDDDLEEYNNPLPAWWLNMFVITLVFGLVYLLLFPGLGKFEGLLGWTSKGRYDKEMEQAAEVYDPIYAQYAAVDFQTLTHDEAAMQTGERLYANYCAQCHGSDARGARGFPNLRDQEWQWGGTPEQIEATILNGRIAVMPGWSTVLGDEGVTHMSHYVRSLSGRSHEAELAARAEQQYVQLCAACHLPDGAGNPLLGAPSLKDRVWLYGGSLETIEETLHLGRNGVMPAFGEFLGPDRVHLVSAYVYSLSQEYERE